MTEFERIEQLLERIDKMLQRLCNVVDPNPGYYQSTDGLWRNRKTNEPQIEELQRQAAKIWGDSGP